jgi:hypothetical protein
MPGMDAEMFQESTAQWPRPRQRDAARALAGGWAPGETDRRRAQIAAYRVVPEIQSAF